MKDRGILKPEKLGKPGSSKSEKDKERRGGEVPSVSLAGLLFSRHG